MLYLINLIKINFFYTFKTKFKKPLSPRMLLQTLPFDSICEVGADVMLIIQHVSIKAKLMFENIFILVTVNLKILLYSIYLY